MAETPAAPSGAGIVTAHILGGTLVLSQPVAGHRAGTDAVLLAAAVPAMSGLLVDAGAGVGTAGLAAALRLPELKFVLVDNDPVAIDLAGRNIVANGMAARGQAIAADLLDGRQRRAAGLGDPSADLVITNPPFLSPRRHRAPNDQAKAHAHVGSGFADEAGFLAAWTSACVAMLASGGWMIMIHRAESLALVLRAFEPGLGGIVILPIYAHAERPAIRVLIGARKGSRAPLRLAAGLILHEAGGAFTPLAEALHRGQASLDWL